MRVVVGSDEESELARAVAHALSEAGHGVEIIGGIAGGADDWADVGLRIAARVAAGQVDEGVAMCWTGTGVAMAANRVPGARAALCGDAETARGARRWNDANILVLSNRATTPAVGLEILRAWLEPTVTDPSEMSAIAKLDPSGP